MRDPASQRDDCQHASNQDHASSPWLATHILPATASVLPVLRSSEVDYRNPSRTMPRILAASKRATPIRSNVRASSAKVFPVINFAISIIVWIAGVGVPVTKPSSLIGIKPVGTSSVTYLWFSVLTALFA